jgi:hypothetical protein
MMTRDMVCFQEVRIRRSSPGRKLVAAAASFSERIVTVAAVEPPFVHITSRKDARRVKAEFQLLPCWIRGNQIKRSQLSLRDSDLPLPSGPVNYAGWICTFQGRTGAEVWIIEGYILNRPIAAAALNVNFARGGVTDAEHVCRFVKDES